LFITEKEGNEEKHEMPNLCSPSGKLIKLNDDQLKGILQNCKNSHAVGGFGKVHVCKSKFAYILNIFTTNLYLRIKKVVGCILV
jgi:hypothetical protein